MKILINSVFVGGYGFNKGNLPHEMINFFKADDEKFYIYITPYGVIDRNISAKDLAAVLFVRNAGNNLVEVLAKAELDEESVLFTDGIQLYGSNNPDSSKIKQIKVDTKAQKERKAKYLADTKNIKYCGKSLADIHSKNAEDNDVFVSLKVKSICLPTKTIYLTSKKDAVALRPHVYYIGHEFNDNGKIANQSMKKYIDSSAHKEGYIVLKDLIDNPDLWFGSSDTPKFDPSVAVEKSNFFKVTRQQDNEVMFTNMFHYIFTEHPKLLRKFSKEILKVELSDSAIAEREKEHMDIRVIDDENYIILENKIKSGINGMKKAEDKDESLNGFKAENGKYISQLSVYYDKAEEKNIKDGKQRTIHCYILTPNHNKINKSLYLRGEKYKEITYKAVHDFLIEYCNDTTNEGASDSFLIDFISAIKKHTEETDNEYRNELMQRLAYRIKNC